MKCKGNKKKQLAEKYLLNPENNFFAIVKNRIESNAYFYDSKKHFSEIKNRFAEIKNQFFESKKEFSRFFDK